MRAALCFLIAISSSSNAATIGPGCGFEWDYSADDQVLIDGFRLYLDGNQAGDVEADMRGISCSDIGLTQGVHVAEVSAFNAAGESAKSESLTFVYVESEPGAPQSLRLVVSFGSP